MKPSILAWCSLVTLMLILSLSLLLGFSLLIDPSPYHWNVLHKGGVWNNLNIMMQRGTILLFNQFEVDSSGHVIPYIDNNPSYSVPRLNTNRIGGHLIIPGFGFRYGQITGEGHVAWSLKFSLVYPLILFLLTAALLHLLSARRGRAARSARLPK
jgi:hypothetical protein